MKTTYREALRAAHREALRRDPRVFLMGEDVGRYGGAFAVTRGAPGSAPRSAASGPSSR